MILFLSWMSLGSLCPDPSQDAIQAVFVHVHHDTAIGETYHHVLMLSDGRCQQVPVFLVPGVTVTMTQCANESALMDEVVTLVRK